MTARALALTAALIAGALAALLACGHVVQRGDRDPPDGERVTDDPAAAPWIVDADTARADLEAGALLLDARDAGQHAAGHLRGAIPVSWLAFSAPGEAERGALHPDDAVLQAAVDALGVRRDTPVRVIGDPVLGWGEDGRVVWTLRTLGHPDAALVDGGHAALAGAGWPADTAAATPPAPDFAIARDDTWTIDTAALRALLDDGAVARGEVIVVDAREPREYAGETPYGEARGGHLPGALPLHYRELLTGSGYLRPRAELDALLAGRGITAGAPVVVYCTGGVRSGWFVAALTALGHADVRNYPGSMWAWAAAPAETHPLETD